MSPDQRPCLKTTALAAAAIAILIWATLGAPGHESGSGGLGSWLVARNSSGHR